MSEYRLKLSEPVYLIIETTKGQEVRVDVFDAEKVLTAATKLPTEEARWDKVKDYLKELLKAEVSLNQAQMFHQAVIKLYNSTWDDISKKVEGIACSQPPTQASQKITKSGRKN